MIPVQSPTAAESAWAVQLRDSQQPLWSYVPGAPSKRPILGHVSVHTWFGGDRTKAEVPHRGVDLWVDTLQNRTLLDSLDATKRPRSVGDVQPLGPALGVDVSHWSGKVDWMALAAGGYTWAIAKATEGMTISDDLYRDHVQGARAVGFPVGGYHFFRTTSDPQAQVRRFLDVAGECEIPPTLDVEWQSEANPLGGLDAATFTEHVRLSLAELASLSGKRPLLYTAPGFWAMLPAGQRRDLAAMSTLWLADYSPPADELDGFDGYAFWQYTGTGTAPGLHPNRGDLNRFAGTHAELLAWLAGGPLPRHEAALDLKTTRGIQAALNRLGTSPVLQVDGIAGPKTKLAIIRFQRANGLEADGVVGRMTRAELAADLADLAA